MELAGINISSASRSGQDTIKDEEMEGKHGKRIKRSLDEMEGAEKLLSFWKKTKFTDGEKRIKKHKGEEKEKKKKKKDKKKKKEKVNFKIPLNKFDYFFKRKTWKMNKRKCTARKKRSPHFFKLLLLLIFFFNKYNKFDK